MYSLLKIRIGTKDTTARPIAWKDKVPTRYITTCTACKGPIQFGPSELIPTDSGIPNLVCSRCGTIATAREVKRPQPFRLDDPIEFGRLSIHGAKRLA